jgi:hypothetical protein
MLNEAPHHEDVWIVEVQLHAFLMSVSDGISEQLLLPTPEERARSTLCLGDAGWTSEPVAKRKFSAAPWLRTQILWPSSL